MGDENKTILARKNDPPMSTKVLSTTQADSIWSVFRDELAIEENDHVSDVENSDSTTTKKCGQVSMNAFLASTFQRPSNPGPEVGIPRSKWYSEYCIKDVKPKSSHFAKYEPNQNQCPFTKL